MTFVPRERAETVGLGGSAAQPPIGSWLQQTTLQLKVSHEEHPERGGAGHHQHCPPVLSTPSSPSALRRDPCPLIRNLAGSRATGLCSWQTSSPAPGCSFLPWLVSGWPLPPLLSLCALSFITYVMNSLHEIPSPMLYVLFSRLTQTETSGFAEDPGLR